MDVLMIEGEVEGAMPNGTRVRKSFMEPGDTHPVGACGTVLSSMGPVTAELMMELPPPIDGALPWTVGEFFYFVEWDDLPDIPVGVRGRKLEAVE